MISVRRVYEARQPGDGRRVLVDGIWPRGLTKSAADLDEWCKDVAPSTELRTWFSHDPDRFAEFQKRYAAELHDPVRAEAVKHLREIARATDLSLVTATKELEVSHAEVLRRRLRPR
jgi:uncharacterized protein YeaO (DUF488 family)